MKIILKQNFLETTRIKKGLSRYSLSKKAGLSKLAISRIEKREVNPTPRTARKICDALNVEFDEIFLIQ